MQFKLKVVVLKDILYLAIHVFEINGTVFIYQLSTPWMDLHKTTYRLERLKYFCLTSTAAAYYPLLCAQ